MSSHAMPFGAQVLGDGRVRFRLWAPAAGRVELWLGPPGAERGLAMEPRGAGWFERVTAAEAGERYRFAVDGGPRVPDPASRFQPEDVHGPSEIIDPEAFDWGPEPWPGRPWAEAVLYELHVGTFSPSGDYAGVMERLDHLVDLGVTALELMPIADFPGARNWGYDGASAFAPDARYGRPEDLKRLVRAAHEKGLMVFLDVVYNHFGPEGNYLHLYAPGFFDPERHTPWGAAINFDGADSGPVRQFFIHNALYWLEEYHLDGLRLDAVHAIADRSRAHFLEELAANVARGPGARRAVHLVLENDDNAAHWLEGGYRAQWSDDLHHVLHLLLTGEDDGYYEDYADDPLGHLGRALAEGFAYQGEPSVYRGGRRRGTPGAHLPPTAFVGFLQNHDQVGNRALGERLVDLASAEAVRAATALLLLSPQIPLLFMGQEWGAREPFPYFCDFEPALAEAVSAGRRREFERFRQFRDPTGRDGIPEPPAPATFASACLDWQAREREEARSWLAFHRDLLALRRAEIAPRAARMGACAGSWRRLGRRALEVSWRLPGDAALVLVANLDGEPAPAEPPPGRWVYRTHPADSGPLPPWFVGWYLSANLP